MVETAITSVQLQNRRVEEHLQQAIDKMDDWTARQTEELRMTEPSRRAVRHAYGKVICSRRYLILPRHTPIERRFLRMMLELSIATDPGLRHRAVELAKYLSGAYPYEWTVSPITHPGRTIAHDLILREADSSFGDTPLAGQLAFVLFHHQKLDITNISDYTKLYSEALSLDKVNYFHTEHIDWRLALGLQHHGEMRRKARGR